MKVKIEITKEEVHEYLNSDLPFSDEEYIETIQSDVTFILEREGFQGTKRENITVTITITHA
ncbi:hypothetical protein ID858_10335 [Xenorhabdus sp. DI]|uniref:hypothetical protein n=1 Tax=Xenorhabdus doucetiae TaxID=351671 RepID=UPI0019CA6E61|nr:MULTISPECIES: hypothetical protein [unclassified Xenorhabdus]MBD2786337.1 hypothetical protein [Xenorhabdus sp. 3]MBD2788908.1 hypothetical protein [Xenorhabdus sp. DI]